SLKSENDLNTTANNINRRVTLALGDRFEHDKRVTGLVKDKVGIKAAQADVANAKLRNKILEDAKNNPDRYENLGSNGVRDKQSGFIYRIESVPTYDSDGLKIGEKSVMKVYD